MGGDGIEDRREGGKSGGRVGGDGIEGGREGRFEIEGGWEEMG